jgi:hypothetical protein
MEVRIGLYAFFGYALSGVAYGTVGWVVVNSLSLAAIDATNKEWPLPMLLVATVLCYFVGLLLDPVSRVLFRVIYRRPSREVAIDTIVRADAEAAALRETYWPLLLAELHLSKESLVEHADVYKAASLLLRNVGTATFSGALIVIGGLYWSPLKFRATVVSVSFFVASALAFIEARKFDCWFYSSICERLLVLRRQTNEHVIKERSP